MRPKLAAAIITGTMARPSRPSVKFTALPAPTMTKAAKGTKNQPRLKRKSLKKGNASEVESGSCAGLRDQEAGDAGDQELDPQPGLAGEALVGLLGDLEVVVVEADRAEADGHEQHDPDVGAAEIGPQQRRDEQAREDHQAAHGGRALLADEVALRPVGADRLALALPDPQRRDDDRAEEKDEDDAP